MKSFIQTFRKKPLQARRRIAIIATGSIGALLIIIMLYTYAHPARHTRDPERGIATAYTTFLNKIQSLFHRK